MLNHIARWALVGGCATSLALGCAGKKVREDFETRQDHTEQLVKEKVDIAPITEGPYHLALRLGGPTIEAMVREAVAPKLADVDMSSNAMGKDMGEQAEQFMEAIEMSRLSVGDIQVSFPSDTDGILRAKVRLQGRIGVRIGKIIELAKSNLAVDPDQKQMLMDILAEAQGGGGAALGGGGGKLGQIIAQFAASDELRWMNIEPEVVVRVFMGAEVVDNRPALVMEMREVESFSLNVDSPFQFAMVSSLVQEVGRKRIASMLTDPAVNPEVRKVIPLPEGASGDLPLKLLGIGLNVRPGDRGEIFMGIATNLNVQPGLSATSEMAPLGDNAWALTIPEGTLGLLLRSMAKEGKLPLRFNRSQEVDPEGPIVVEPETISLNEGGFVMGTRIWNLKTPAFWRHFDIKGSFAVENGQLTPRIDKIEGTDEGAGNLWASGIVEKKQESASEKTVSGAGKRTSPSLPLPMSGGKRVLQLDVANAVANSGSLTIMGGVTVKDAPTDG